MGKWITNESAQAERNVGDPDHGTGKNHPNGSGFTYLFMLYDLN